MQYEFVLAHHYKAYKIYEELYGFDNANNDLNLNEVFAAMTELDDCWHYTWTIQTEIRLHILIDKS